ncbi:MAG: bifunctional hydroxymethylpyrimidine kinase/phosphomethylpyrimidine kinase, partial [Desulfovibrionaceae bacterium]
DSGGGAGIQADLKTFAMHGVYGASVITALTAQNTREVAGIHAPPARFVAQQLDAVLSDIPFQAAKTGMLFSAPIIRAVASRLEARPFPLVVDPVCVAQSGGRLLEDSAMGAMRDLIFPLADLLTPNRPEAEYFTGLKIERAEDIAEAAEKLLAMGPKAVLIKGGHMRDSVAVTDWLCTPGDKPLALMQQRVRTNNNHGTGCTLSAAIAANLAKGLTMAEAVRAAQRYLNLCLRAAFDLGQGSGPANHLAPMLKAQARARVLERLSDLGRGLAAIPGLAKLAPEVRMDPVLAAPLATGPEDVAGFTGRLAATRRGELLLGGCPEFGASANMAAVLLSARKVREGVECAVNIRHDDEVLAALGETGAELAWLDRAAEPGASPGREAATLEWAVCRALNDHPHPDRVVAVCDPGADGVEAQVYLLADRPEDLPERLMALLAAL